MTELNFDSEGIDPIGNFEVLPIGDYVVAITASDKKRNNKNTGDLLQLTLDVLDGEYKGRKIFERLNVVNENKTAQDIAQRSLSAICHVTGVAHPRHSEELHNKPFMVKLGIRPAKGEFNETNSVLEWKFADGRRLKDVLKPAAKAQNTTPVASSAAAAAPANKSKRPWEK